jgi:serine/threonine protein phosphatase PrpC
MVVIAVPASLAAPAACPSCGRPVGPDDNFCEACGARLSQPARNGSVSEMAGACPFCRSAGSSPDGYCESCGRRLPSNRDHDELDLRLLAGVTDRGLRHHRNEDAMALATTQLAGGPAAVAVVCDGVSGSVRPDEAARVTAQTMLYALTAAMSNGDDLVWASTEAVESARKALVDLAVPGAPGASGALADNVPATTFVCAALAGQAVTLSWLGDSRAYWLRAGPHAAAEQLTRDDSVAAEMVAAGLESETSVLALPQAHVLTRWLGADISDAPHVVRFEPPGPGVLLLCSDGLWNYQPDGAELARLAMPTALTDPLGAASALVRFALAAGGMDNVTVVLAPFPYAPTRPQINPTARRARP